MRYLILSDIHGNWEALDAVLQDAQDRYDQICCLGDVVGYGADPNRVTDWVRENIEPIIRGNHDKTCCGLEDPVMFNPIARQAVEWTRENLTETNLEYLRKLPQGPTELNGFLIVHGSVLDEDEYLIDPRDAMSQFDAVEGRLVFFGHTHVQGGFLLREVGSEPAKQGSKPAGQFLPVVPGEPQLLNPGSVGQPRDLDWKAGYAIYDSDRQVVEFRRCSYDLKTAQRKIVEAGLPPALADRLAEGR